jgi:hypothetical protein
MTIFLLWGLLIFVGSLIFRVRASLVVARFVFGFDANFDRHSYSAHLGAE